MLDIAQVAYVSEVKWNIQKSVGILQRMLAPSSVCTGEAPSVALALHLQWQAFKRRAN